MFGASRPKCGMRVRVMPTVPLQAMVDAGVFQRGKYAQHARPHEFGDVRGDVPIAFAPGEDQPVVALLRVVVQHMARVGHGHIAGQDVRGGSSGSVAIRKPLDMGDIGREFRRQRAAEGVRRQDHPVRRHASSRCADSCRRCAFDGEGPPSARKAERPTPAPARQTPGEFEWMEMAAGRVPSARRDTERCRGTRRSPRDPSCGCRMRHSGRADRRFPRRVRARRGRLCAAMTRPCFRSQPSAASSKTSVRASSPSRQRSRACFAPSHASRYAWLLRWTGMDLPAIAARCGVTDFVRLQQRDLRAGSAPNGAPPTGRCSRRRSRKRRSADCRQAPAGRSAAPRLPHRSPVARLS